MRIPKLTSRQITILVLAFTVLFILVLATGITGLSFQPGEPFISAPDPKSENATGLVPNGDLLLGFFRGLLSLSVILLPIYILLLIFNKRARKRLLTDIPLILLMLLALYLMRDVAQREPEDSKFQDLTMQQDGAELNPDLSEAPPVPDLPQGAVTAATAAVAVGVAGAAAGLFWFIRKNLLQPRPAPVDVIADEAQEALDNLYAGGDLRETIQQCYKRMLEAVAKQRNLLRSVDMTPNEFGQHLIDRGLPARPVRELTALFEQARYSSRPTGPKEHQQAIHSLSSIIAAIRNPEPTP
jgi:hypothetical protein